MPYSHKIGGHETTVVTSDSGVLSVTYHNTEVVSASPKKIILDTGGWFSVTTKLRMNQASSEYGLDYGVFQHKGEWFIAYQGFTLPWGDSNVFLLLRQPGFAQKYLELYEKRKARADRRAEKAASRISYIRKQETTKQERIISSGFHVGKFLFLRPPCVEKVTDLFSAPPRESPTGAARVCLSLRNTIRIYIQFEPATYAGRAGLFSLWALSPKGTNLHRLMDASHQGNTMAAGLSPERVLYYVKKFGRRRNIKGLL